MNYTKRVLTYEPFRMGRYEEKISSTHRAPPYIFSGAYVPPNVQNIGYQDLQCSPPILFVCASHGMPKNMKFVISSDVEESAIHPPTCILCCERVRNSENLITPSWIPWTSQRFSPSIHKDIASTVLNRSCQCHWRFKSRILFQWTCYVKPTKPMATQDSTTGTTSLPDSKNTIWHWIQLAVKSNCYRWLQLII